MSVCLEIDNFTDEELDKMSEELVVWPVSKMKANPTPVYPYLVDKEKVYLPFHYGVNQCNLELDFSDQVKNCAVKWGAFEGQLREDQQSIVNDTLDFFAKFKSCFLAINCGGGKTAMSIYLAQKIGLKTLFLIHRINLKYQTLYEVNKFSPKTSAQVFDGKLKNFNPNAAFTIASIKMLNKMPAKFLQEIGLLIVDESHSCVTEKSFTQMIRLVQPCYALGLSATPDRPDGLGKMLDFVFGSNRIVRKLYCPHYVYRLKTPYKPTIRYNVRDQVDWTHVLETQAENEARNKLIVALVQFFPTYNFLLLCKRVSQANTLLEMLTEEKESVTILVASQKTFCFDARILITTFSKSGVGFDHPKLNGLIICGDVDAPVDKSKEDALTNFAQYHGRIFRRLDQNPIVIDIVDNYSIFDNHWRNRRKYYLNTGGIVQNFPKEFPSFDYQMEDNSIVEEEPAVKPKPKKKNWYHKQRGQIATSSVEND